MSLNNLYDFPKTWVDYDPEKRRITKRGKAQLERMLLAEIDRELDEINQELASAINRDNGRSKSNGREDNHKKANATDFWKLFNQQGKDKVSRDQAQEWAQAGDWEVAIENLKGALN